MTNTASSPLGVENHLYLIERIGPPDYDEAIGHVVVARDESAARLLAACAAGCEGVLVWADPALSTIEMLGIASPGEEPRVVLTDFRHG